MNQLLIREAWLAQTQASAPRSKIKVGCAIEAIDGTIVSGWNVEGPWQTSIHAEVHTCLRLRKPGQVIVVASECSYFTACGNCLDWLFYTCGKDAEFIAVNKAGIILTKCLSELMPFYPKL